MKERSIQNFLIALEAIQANKMRSVLTALGIIFGVASVIAMLAIGKGAEQEILEQMKLVGVNNIVIAPSKEQKESKTDPTVKENESKRFSPGLTIKDAESIREVLDCVDKISPEIVVETDFIYNGLRRSGKLVGTLPEYFEISNFTMLEGAVFNEAQMRYGDQVCIIGKSIMTKFFAGQDPIAKYIKCGNVWLKVIGVLNERTITENSISNLGIRDYNMDIYVPLKTMLLRFTNRTLVTKSGIEAAQENGDETPAEKNHNQLDRLVVRLFDSDQMSSAAEVISRLMFRRHNRVTDFEISIPEQMLQQQQSTKDLFYWVLRAIAAISLLVGGIGIMNIMFASVMERIKEIGIRLAIGANQKDIVQQFIFEAVLISISGGILGIMLGVLLSYIISAAANIPTIIGGGSIVLSFAVSVLIGLIFGISPARKAAKEDPINSLRHE
jgi:putative ABC transport system permease protein